jgi:DNA-binding MarR family transcriptional regulator
MDHETETIEVALVRLRRAMTRRALGRRAAPEADLSLVSVADALEDGPASVGELAERLALDQSRASRLSARAIDAGWVARAGAPEDRRVSVLSLTDDGRAALAVARQTRRAMVETALSDWTAEERAEFARLFERFVAATTDELSRPR